MAQDLLDFNSFYLGHFSSVTPFRLLSPRELPPSPNSWMYQQLSLNIPPKRLVFLGFKRHTELLDPDPVPWKTTTPQEGVRTQKSIFVTFFLPDSLGSSQRGVK